MQYEPRDSIIDVLDCLYASKSMKPSEADKKLNLKAWHFALEEIDDELIYNGFRKAVKISGYMIDSGGFRNLCMSSGDLTSIEDEAILAWAEAFENLNYYSSPVFKNSVIAETIRQMGGWKSFCSMLESEKAFRKKEFTGIYSTMKKLNQTYQHQLHGEFETVKFIGFSSREEEKELLGSIKLEEETIKQIARL